MLTTSNDRPQIRINVERKSAKYFLEPLNDAIALEMVVIPAGEFTMGSPPEEIDRLSREGPQRQVAIDEFYLGRYPVTQAQWEVVAGWELVSQELESNPSRFKGSDRPVEKVSWKDAVEFCARLKARTGKAYRLPSEAEWEYACRAGTTTPFHFGETITTDLANYRGTDYEELNWSGSYGDGPKGEFRNQTTEVGQFGYANSFGLFDMHGNVWEWCADRWHENYEGAPPGGTPWNEGEETRRVLRGGSWGIVPAFCRSASRCWDLPGDRSYGYGFRVACSPASGSSPLPS